MVLTSNGSVVSSENLSYADDTAKRIDDGFVRERNAWVEVSNSLRMMGDLFYANHRVLPEHCSLYPCEKYSLSRRIEQLQKEGKCFLKELEEYESLEDKKYTDMLNVLNYTRDSLDKMKKIVDDEIHLENKMLSASTRNELEGMAKSVIERFDEVIDKYHMISDASSMIMDWKGQLSCILRKERNDLYELFGFLGFVRYLSELSCKFENLRRNSVQTFNDVVDLQMYFGWKCARMLNVLNLKVKKFDEMRKMIDVVEVLSEDVRKKLGCVVKKLIGEFDDVLGDEDVELEDEAMVVHN